jgi:hypothetical protein
VNTARLSSRRMFKGANQVSYSCELTDARKCLATPGHGSLAGKSTSYKLNDVKVLGG